jgi:phosphatidylglycerol:prolipoprotein diacylglycerol transferase
VDGAYPVALALGCLAGLSWLTLRRGVSAAAFPVALGALAMGLVGARIGFAVVHGAYFLENPIEAAWVWQGGLSWVGAALGAIVAVALFAAVRRLRLAATADDIVIPALLVALAAWIGCYLDGCVIGLRVPAGPLAPLSPDLFGVVAPRWPTAAAGMIATGALLCGFLLLDGVQIGPGRRAVSALAGVAAIGLGLSFTRADPMLRIGALRLDSLGAVLLLVLALGLALFVRRESRGTRL